MPVIQASPPVSQLTVDSSAIQSQMRKTKERTDKPNTRRTQTANREARVSSPSPSARLQIKANSKGKQESWTVATTTKPLTKGSKQTCFRVRVSDVGFRVCLVYYDGQGKRREPYLCYLSAKEWQQAKRGNLANFAQAVADKLADRSSKEGADGNKLDELSHRVRGFL